MFGNGDPDARDLLIQELREDKQRLLAENADLRERVLLLTDAKAYTLLHRREFMDRSAGLVPQTQLVSLEQKKSQVYKAPVSFDEIAKQFETSFDSESPMPKAD
jgi:hypothetical protein